MRFSNNFRTIAVKIFKRLLRFKYVNLDFCWDDIWLKYFEKINVHATTQALVQDMDKVSYDYAFNHIKLIQMLPHKAHFVIEKNYGWTAEDIAVKKNATTLASKNKLSFAEAFLHTNMYGLKDLISAMQQRIDGKYVIDGGAYTGDTFFLFQQLFPASSFILFEPQTSAFEQLQKNININRLQDKCVLFKNGLGNKEETLQLYASTDMDAGATCNVQAIFNKSPSQSIELTTIDKALAEKKGSVGLIKLDIEGFEKKAVEGAYAIIKRDRPVVIAAIYHNPVDFFEIKEYLLNIHPDYKFMIRRSEMVIPLADIVLIAY